MNRSALWILLVAALAGLVGAVLWWHGRDRGPVAYVVDSEPAPVEEKVNPTVHVPEWATTRRGGTYSGVVVEAAGGAPIADARVLLVATSDDQKVAVVTGEADAGGPVQDIPVFGSFRIAAETTTDAKGAFQVSGGDARVVAIFALEPGHGPGMKAHLRTAPLLPGPGHEIRLAKAGAIVGRVVDKVTRAPVAGVDVAIYLQHPANQTEQGTVPFTATSSFARFQAFITHELGAKIWGIEPRGNDAALHLETDREGMFRLGPLMKEVQLEIVFTHRDYAWTETDPEVSLIRDNPGTDPAGKELRRVRRTVVPPGETIERTFELSKGKEISGTVTDEKGVAFEDVVVALEHVAQYSQHHFYRTRSRYARTDRAGKFRLAGLSYGPYVLTLTHPAFERKVFQPIAEASNETYVIPRGGWIEVKVTGALEDRKDFVAELRLTRVDKGGGGVDQRERILVRDGGFVAEKIEPGRYDVALASGRLIASPVRVEVAAGAGAIAELTLRNGGGFRVTVTNSYGLPVDPATGDVELVTESGGVQRAGLVVSRGGVFETEGLTAGTYRLSARAPGYVPKASEPFAVAADQMTAVPTLVMLRSGVVRITSIKDENGRVPGEGVIKDLAVIQGDGTPVAMGALAAGSVTVVPGTVVIRFNLSDGRVADTRVDVAEGATVPVDVVIPSP